MSTTYSVVSGDDFAAVSRRAYGSADNAGLIAAANPGTSEPLTAGTVLTVPTDGAKPTGANAAGVSGGVDEVSLLVDGVRFRYWSELRVTRSVDTIDTISLSAPFDPSDTAMRAAFKPFGFTPLQVAVGGEALFAGTAVSVLPDVTPQGKTITVDGYAAPGVLNDCTPPASAYPLEFNGVGLSTIATSLARPFGLGVEFSAAQGATFERVACPPGTKVLEFLTGLATQRNLVIGSTTEGAVEFRQSVDAGSPVAILTQGEPPLVSVAPSFRPQQYYSHVTGIEPVLVGLAGSQHTYTNALLPGVLRPLTFTAADTLDADLPDAVNAKAARMFANMAAYSVVVATWRDPAGDMWAPNTTVKVTAPGAMVYSAYEFLIRSVELITSSTERTAVLTLVMPGAFKGEAPGSLPWDG